MQSDVRIVKDHASGAIGRIVELHGSYYRRYGFGPFFEDKVARELTAFLGRGDAQRDGLWLALLDDEVHGAIAIDGLHAGADAAHLRWFIASDSLRGSGAGNALLSAALDFCRAREYPRIRLWTFAGLDAARHLYEKHGFYLVRQQRGAQWGAEVDEQCFEWPRPTQHTERTEESDG
jgi:GNAT superfamily N-acetyltransferase